ncbi:hypothetical protein B0T11DRAFT_297598 [Plectosphaerella cucumerina]|uniref:Uncharacterized protein n=1 Tax=Plectosphaerella cucumerina TaxID=40658 RepID=A0A8K0X2Z3_9PEZI|nr:hypothetical protein B0T11DRAFT_297598 [Plectosphaerella cucumerina]
MMGDIYAAASRIFIWLGKEADEIKMAFGWLRRFNTVTDSLGFETSVSEDGTDFITRARFDRILLKDEFTLLCLRPLEAAKTLEFKCTDPRDHVFSMLGIASDANRFDLIDYRSPTEKVYRELAYSCLSDSICLKLLWSLASRTPLTRRVRELFGHPVLGSTGERLRRCRGYSVASAK